MTNRRTPDPASPLGSDGLDDLIDIVNKWLDSSNLADVTLCESGEIKGMHGGLNVGGANPLIKEVNDWHKRSMLRLVGEDEDPNLHLGMSAADYGRSIAQNQLRAELREAIEREDK